MQVHPDELGFKLEVINNVFCRYLVSLDLRALLFTTLNLLVHHAKLSKG